MTQVYLNGRYVDEGQALVSVTDRGFLFGDGVYEVTRAAAGALMEADRHVRRLTGGLRALAIGLADDAVGALPDISRRLLRANGVDGDGLVYWQVTRGAAPRAHQFPPAGTPPTVLVSVSAAALPHALRERGAAAVTVPDIRWARCDIKSVNLLPNVLAKQHAVRAGADEAIFVRDGIVTEGASSTIFAVVDDELRTYPLCPYILPGITREIVLQLAGELGLAVRQVPVLGEELPGAAELFLTSTNNDIMPIVRVDGRAVGSGRPGPVTQRLYAVFTERTGAVAGAR
jgi:D-alanine transaminase